MLNRLSLPLGLLTALLCLQPAYAQQGGIEISSAETLGDGILRISLSYLYEYRGNQYEGDDHVNDPQNQNLQTHTTVLGVDYGLLPRLTISALIPVERNELSLRDPVVGTTRLRAYGLGDIAVLAKFRAFKLDWKQGAFHLALIAGVECPTGVPSARKDGVRLPTSVQVGGGSWNPILALTTNLNFNRLRVDASVFYTINTRGQHDFDGGDEVLVKLDLAYRFWHAQYPGPSASAKLGVRLHQEGHSVEDGESLTNTGETVVVVRPGVSFHPIPRIDMTLGVDIPIYQYFHGRQLGRDVRVSCAFGIRF